MVCEKLISFGIPRTALQFGMQFAEPPVDESNMSELVAIHNGKEGAIEHMLQGGNGYPICCGIEFQTGASYERRDLHELIRWEENLQRCLLDRKAGVK